MMRNHFFSFLRTNNIFVFHIICMAFIITLGIISITASGGGDEDDNDTGGETTDTVPVGWSSLGSGMNSPVFTLAASDNGTMYAGGYFKIAGSIETNYIASWSF